MKQEGPNWVLRLPLEMMVCSFRFFDNIGLLTPRLQISKAKLTVSLFTEVSLPHLLAMFDFK